MSAATYARTEVREQRDTFACFGSDCTVVVADARADRAAAGLALARQRLLQWHARFSRFEPASELSRLNRDPRETVPVSALMRRIVAAGVRGAIATGGLVDPALGAQIEQAGYFADLPTPALALTEALRRAPERRPAAGDPRARWREIHADRRHSTVTRPPALRIDPGGIAKGVFADELASLLASHDAFAVDCAGDLRIGGRERTPRQVEVISPFDDSVLHRLQIADGAAATSGIGRRGWVDAAGAPCHHLLDPSTGRPAFTGLVQVTALAPTATDAEVLAKAALLSGPEDAAAWLPHGGVLVLDDGRCRVLQPAIGSSAQGTTTASS